MAVKNFARRVARVPLVALLFGMPAAQVAAVTLDQIRATGMITVCADPANLPLSDSGLNPPGYDIEIADEIAKHLGAKLQYNWFVTAYLARVLGELYSEKCDFILGLPTDKRLEGVSTRIALSKPYLTTGFVTVVAADVQARALDDLKGKRIGVEMHSVADFRLFGLGHERGLYPNQAALFKALADREVSAAVMWAPMVGWSLKQQNSVQVKVLPESRTEFSFPLAVAVRKDDPELLSAINEAIDGLILSGRRDQILAKYNFPGFTSRIKSSMVVAAAGAATTPDAATAQQPRKKGYSLYHQACAKCHGRSVISGGIVPDLRRFNGGDEDFFAIVKNGRPGTAMSAWKDLLSDEEIRDIQEYVKSIITD
jgi:polar amino acid transport system substrate-binding protein